MPINEFQDLEAAVAEVLATEEFQRSPVSSRLLEYLLRTTIEGETIKAYAIATDGLGRTLTQLGDSDTYARVAVARLRKALDGYYAEHPEADAIQVDVGTYRLSLRRSQAQASNGLLEHDASVRPDELAIKGGSSLGSKTLLIALAAIAGIAIIMASEWQRPADQPWLKNDFPTVAVAVPVVGVANMWTNSEAEANRRSLNEALGDYAGIRVIDGKIEESDFKITMTLLPAMTNNAPREIFEAIETRDGHVIWSKTFVTSSDDEVRQNALEVAYDLASPGGAIVGFRRRQGFESNSPYGCWLRFTEDVQTLSTADDEKFADCSARWYAAAPQRPMAAFLHGWALLDRATRTRNATDRNKALNQGLDVIHRAMALNSDFPLLYVAEVRGYSLAGNRAMVARSGRDALAMAGSNRLIAGLVASELALWNDPEGMRTLDSLSSYPGAAPPWESIGRFIEAAMQDDVAGAVKASEGIERMASGQPRLLLLLAAVKARQGDRAGSLAIIRRLMADKRLPPADGLVMETPFGVAPEVAAQLREWLSMAAPPN